MQTSDAFGPLRARVLHLTHDSDRCIGESGNFLRQAHVFDGPAAHLVTSLHPMQTNAAGVAG
jgi:hypothetical protein